MPLQRSRTGPSITETNVATLHSGQRYKLYYDYVLKLQSVSVSQKFTFVKPNLILHTARKIGLLYKN